MGINVLLAAGVTVCAAGALEGIARVAERRRPPPQVAGYIWDWEVEWDGEFPSGLPQVLPWPPAEANGDGFRDRWHPAQGLEGTWRVAFLGDSVTMGAGIEAAQAFPQVVQSLLDGAGRPVEVFNAGMIGWSTRQERIAYERLLRRYRPRQVVLGVCLNDIPELRNNLVRPPAWLAALHARSAVVRLAVNAPAREIQRVEEIFARPDAPKVVDGFARFFDEVRALRALVEADGARFAVLVFPFRFQVAAGAPAPTAQRTIGAFCAREGLPCLDLLPSLAPLGERAFVDYDHFSPEGARRVAEAVLEHGMVEGPPAPAAAGGAGDPAALQATLRGDPSPDARAAAARALARASSAPSAALFEALHDPHQAVRWEAARGLAKSELDATALPALERALRVPDAYVRSFAAWRLGALGPAARGSAPALVAALREEGAYGPSGAADALARIGATDAAPALLDGLRAAEAGPRAAAATALGTLGGGEAAVSALAAALRDPEATVRTAAVRALGRLGPSARPALPALVAVLGDPHADVRVAAADALCAPGLEDRSAVPGLIAALGDASADVRTAAARALGRPALRATDAVPRLAAALEDRNKAVRVQAARSLGAFGPYARPALPALRRAAQDPRGAVRRAAQEALRRLGAS
ncbi:MAG TPA: HEAT repeat domain-containing protein [Vicinamibacteria bacterium]|jgi:HEAT repeat protein